MKWCFVIFLIYVISATGAQGQSLTLPADTMIDRYAKQQTAEVLRTLPTYEFVKASLSKNSVYAGEPFCVTYRLYSLYDCELIAPVQPNFADCSVQELNIPDKVTIEPVKNLFYRVSVLRSVQLTPFQEGKLIIDSTSVPLNVMIRSTEYPHDYHHYKANIAVPAQVVQVKALPQKGRPGDFKNVTGKFSIETRLADSLLPAGKTNHLYVTLKGQGNLDAINAPLINWPQGVEFFDATDSQYIRADSFPVQGEKTFDFPFVVKKAGSIEMPAVRFSFFNPSKSRYETIIAKSLLLTVTSQETESIQDFSLDVINNNKLLWIVPAIALVVITALALRHQKTAKGKHVKQNEVVNIPEVITALPIKNNLMAAPVPVFFDKTIFVNLDTGGDTGLFCNQAAEAIRLWISASIGQTQFNDREINQLLAEKGITQQQIDAIIQLQHEIQIYLYAKGSIEPDKIAIKEALIKLPDVQTAAL